MNSAPGMYISHLSPCTINCMASVQPLMTCVVCGGVCVCVCVCARARGFVGACMKVCVCGCICAINMHTCIQYWLFFLASLRPSGS